MVKWGRKSHDKAGAGGAESIREGLDCAKLKEKEERDTARRLVKMIDHRTAECATTPSIVDVKHDARASGQYVRPG